MYLPDVAPQPIFGPTLRLATKLLRWEEPGGRGERKGVRERVLLESGVGEMTTSYLAMENTGTTALYFSWQVCGDYGTASRIRCVTSTHSRWGLTRTVSLPSSVGPSPTPLGPPRLGTSRDSTSTPEEACPHKYSLNG